MKADLAKVSEYEKNPCAAGWFINLVTKTMVVSTDAIKEMAPMIIYTCASSMATTVNSNRNSGRIKTPTPITMCNVTIPIFCQYWWGFGKKECLPYSFTFSVLMKILFKHTIYKVVYSNFNQWSIKLIFMQVQCNLSKFGYNDFVSKVMCVSK